MTEIKYTPQEVKQPLQHNSGHIRSTPAGGEVSRDQYQRPLPEKNGGPRNDGSR
jgi:hypothetical protein